MPTTRDECGVRGCGKPPLGWTEVLGLAQLTDAAIRALTGTSAPTVLIDVCEDHAKELRGE